MGRILLIHALALLIFAGFTQWEASENARLIKANGSANDLQAGFHSRRTWIRLWWWAACTLGAALVVALWSTLAALVTIPALGVLLGGYFFRTFSPQLNVKMGLAYKARFYASPSGKTFPDKQVWAGVRGEHPNVPDAQLQETANSVNHHLLNYVGLACLLVYAGITAYLCFSPMSILAWW